MDEIKEQVEAVRDFVREYRPTVSEFKLLESIAERMRGITDDIDEYLVNKRLGLI